MEKIYQEEESKALKLLTSQFSNKLSRENAIHQLATTQSVRTPLFPTLQVEGQLIIAEKERSGNITQTSGATSTTPKRKNHLIAKNAKSLC